MAIFQNGKISYQGKVVKVTTTETYRKRVHMPPKLEKTYFAIVINDNGGYSKIRVGYEHNNNDAIVDASLEDRKKFLKHTQNKLAAIRVKAQAYYSYMENNCLLTTGKKVTCVSCRSKVRLLRNLGCPKCGWINE